MRKISPIKPSILIVFSNADSTEDRGPGFVNCRALFASRCNGGGYPEENPPVSIDVMNQYKERQAQPEAKP